MRIRALFLVLSVGLSPALAREFADDWRAEVAALIHGGRFGEAEKIAERAATQDRGLHPPFFMMLAGYWRLLYDPDDAGLQMDFESRIGGTLEAAERRLEEARGDGEALWVEGTSRLFLAELRAKQRRPLAAAKESRRSRSALESALAARPDLADIRFGLGTLDVIAGRAPTFARGIAAVFGVHGDLDRGLQHLSAAARDGKFLSLESEIFLLTVHSNRRQPNFAEAEASALAMADRATSLVALHACARVLLAVGAPERAAHLLDDALARAARAPQADRVVADTLRVARARTDFALFRPDLALERLRSVASTPDALPRKVREEASQVLRDAAEAGARPGWLPDLAATLGVPLPSHAGPESAATSLDRALPALELLREGSPSRAADLLASLASSDPGDPVLALLAGRASLAAGRPGAARRWLERAASTDGLPTGWKGPCFLLAGMAADLDGDRAAALGFYRRAAEAPSFPSRDAASLLQERPYRGPS